MYILFRKKQNKKEESCIFALKFILNYRYALAYADRFHA